MWEFHDKFSFSISPKQLKSLRRSIFVPNTVSHEDKSNGFFGHLQKNMYLFFHIQWKFVYCQPVIDFGKFCIDYRYR